MIEFFLGIFVTYHKMLILIKNHVILAYINT